MNHDSNQMHPARISSTISRRRFLQGMGQTAGAAVLGGALLSVANEEAYAAFPPDSRSVAETTHGKVRGGVVDGIHLFRGIPYGAPTDGKRRFLPPEAPKSWRGVRDTLEYGTSCPQTPYDLVKPAAISWFTPFFTQTSSEDCLCLNVWTPGLNDGGKRPVMVWLHGGGYARGSGASSSYEGTNIARRGDVVAITINHRLNAFGYTHFGDILGDEYESSGNAGMLDIVQALRWVRDNAEQFGGDPNNVMIYGESGGGAKVSTLCGMPAAKGLFHRAVIQSGPSLRVEEPEIATNAAQHFLDALGLKKGDVKKLQRVSSDQIVSAMTEASTRAAGRAFRPVLGSAIPAHPFDPVASDLSADVPIMVGSNQHEVTLFLTGSKALFEMDDAGMKAAVGRLRNMGDHSDEMIASYRKAHPDVSPSELYFIMASDQRMRIGSTVLADRKYEQDRAPVYVYRFDWRAPAWEGRMMAAHAFEIPFVFDNTNMNSDITGGSPEAKSLGARMSDAWIAFARSGNPNHAELPGWPAYTTSDRATMLFNNDCAVANDPGAAQRKLWLEVDSYWNRSDS